MIKPIIYGLIDLFAGQSWLVNGSMAFIDLISLLNDLLNIG